MERKLNSYITYKYTRDSLSDYLSLHCYLSLYILDIFPILLNYLKYKCYPKV